MPTTDRQQAVLDVLKGLHSTGTSGLKELLWTHLNFERQNQPLSTRKWPDGARAVLCGDPAVVACGGEEGVFHVIHCRLSGTRLRRGPERPIVGQLLREHPYSLFVFSNENDSTWHFVNVKYSENLDSRRLFRRIVVEPGAGLRTAAERLAMLDLDSAGRELFAVPPLEIQSRCDEAFDVEAVTKVFYREIANWYFWALKHVRFPKDSPKEADGRDHIGVIRLITRIIFCWFIKEKGLLPRELFDEGFAANLLEGFNPTKDSDKASVYYKALLQNLFFATLNTEMDKRGWANGDPNHFMAHSLYRHKECFKKPGTALDLFKNIPFLNGGLFECLDRDLGDKAKPRYRRIDGFSRRPDCQPTVPDFLFFGSDHKVDLSEEYGEHNYSNVNVRGLIKTFEQYRFTITENTPIDQEVALDPELSGKVFENLLAAYNPETGATARKATGSFYTPREIVDYMVDESLIAHLKDKLGPAGADADERLRHLFAYDRDGHRFDGRETALLIEAIDHVKILDPAVGSGAFPMGALHKLVFILSKLDPHNEKWKERQTGKVRADIRAAENIEDGDVREKTIAELEQRLSDIEDAFAKNDLDYGRKLYLIENCIFGVDIQTIAVQIAKMRFFISLVVDQKVDPDAPNMGVRPLPNLETRFVAANTLVGVDKPGEQLLRNIAIQKKETELRRVRERHFMARSLAAKRRCREQDARLRAEIAKLLETDGWDSRTARMRSSWDPYDQNASAPFFDPEWMFGVSVGKQVRRGAATITGKFSAVAQDELTPRTVEQGGFDVVIGNPPYVRQEQIKEQKPQFQKTYECFTGTADLYVYFYERAVNLLRQGGFLSFISSNKWYRAAYGEKLREWLPRKTRILRLIDFGDAPVFTSIAYPTIVVAKRATDDAPSEVRALNWKPSWRLDEFHARVESDTNLLDASSLKPECWQFEKPGGRRIIDKLNRSGTPLREFVGSRVYRGITTGLNQAFVVDRQTRDRLVAEHASSEQLVKPFLRGRDVDRWTCVFSDQYLIKIESSENKSNPWKGRSEKEAERIFENAFPAIHAHFDTMRRSLVERYDQGKYFWELRSCEYWREFSVPKLVSTKISIKPTFSIDADGFFLANTSYFVPTSDFGVYLAGILNSAVFFAYAKSVFVQKQNGWYEVQPQGLETFPVPNADVKERKELESAVARILAAKKADAGADVSGWEREIDERVYRLYGLTRDEIKIVEEGE